MPTMCQVLLWGLRKSSEQSRQCPVFVELIFEMLKVGDRKRMDTEINMVCQEAMPLKKNKAERRSQEVWGVEREEGLLYHRR